MVYPSCPAVRLVQAVAPTADRRQRTSVRGHIQHGLPEQGGLSRAAQAEEQAYTVVRWAIEVAGRSREFIDSAALLSDVYAAQGMKIVLSGTDSLGFWFALRQVPFGAAGFDASML